MRTIRLVVFAAFLFSAPVSCKEAARGDHIRDLQDAAVKAKKADWGRWGTDPNKYSSWTSHSNRLIPVYTFGLKLDSVRGANSVYRDAKKLTALYGRLPKETLNPTAEYFDQTDVYRLQVEAIRAGKKNVILVVFDGMDWQTTWATAIHQTQQVGYRQGRGAGLFFQDYRGVTTDFGYFVTSPHNDGTTYDVNAQAVKNPGGKTPGGYDPKRGGLYPWSIPSDPKYIIAQSRDMKHAYTDSAASATSLTAGIKTYNGAVNVDYSGQQVIPIARTLQQKGWSVGVLTSVPFSHATPACAYANNVYRYDYQDIARDLLGLPSVSHKKIALSGMDVVIGAGWGNNSDKDSGQGANYVKGNKYVDLADVAKIDVKNGGKYVVAQRAAGVSGKASLAQAAALAAQKKARLFGLYGCKNGDLAYQTADGQFDPTKGGASSSTTTTPAKTDDKSTTGSPAKTPATPESKTPAAPPAKTPAARSPSAKTPVKPPAKTPAKGAGNPRAVFAPEKTPAPAKTAPAGGGEKLPDDDAAAASDDKDGKDDKDDTKGEDKPGSTFVESAVPVYQKADVFENPTLADMTRAALTVLSTNPKGFWLMVEAGDVDWANHNNNIDSSIGSVKSGDDAFRAVVEWVEARDGWKETVVLVTSDHGHYLVLDKPEALIAPSEAKK